MANWSRRFPIAGKDPPASTAAPRRSHLTSASIDDFDAFNDRLKAAGTCVQSHWDRWSKWRRDEDERIKGSDDNPGTTRLR